MKVRVRVASLNPSSLNHHGITCESVDAHGFDLLMSWEPPRGQIKYIFVVDFLFIVTPIVGVCNCSMFCCTLLYVNSSIAIILMGKRELIALLNLSSWCLVMTEGLFLAVPQGSMQFVIVVFPDHTHLLFLRTTSKVRIRTEPS